MKHPKFS